VGCNGGTVDRHALGKDAQAVDSLACEGALLAGNVADGESTTAFTRVHAGDLSQRASNFEDALSHRPTLLRIEPDVRELGRKAGRVADLLENLRRRPTDRKSADRLERELSNTGDCA
jgi:hypothetical protein